MRKNLFCAYTLYGCDSQFDVQSDKTGGRNLVFEAFKWHFSLPQEQSHIKKADLGCAATEKNNDVIFLSLFCQQWNIAA